MGEVIFHYPLMELQCTLGHRRPTAATRCRNPRRACRHSVEISRGSVGFLVIVSMMVFGEYEVMSEAVMSVFKDFSHVATPGRDPPGYQFPMLTQNSILRSVVVAVVVMSVFEGF